jgi:hypothetical protein
VTTDQHRGQVSSHQAVFPLAEEVGRLDADLSQMVSEGFGMFCLTGLKGNILLIISYLLGNYRKSTTRKKS